MQLPSLISAPAERDTALAQLDALERCAERFETPCGSGSLVWHRWGSGDPLVLLHGSHGWWGHWARNIAALSRDYTLWVPDLPGMGKSSGPDGQDHSAVVGPLAQGLTQLGVGAAALVGFSYGAVIATHLALGYPEVARRVVIINPGGLGTPLGRFELKPMKDLDREGRKDAARHNLGALMFKDPSAIDALTLEVQSRGARLNRFDAAPLIMPDHIINVLAEVAVPVHAIWASHDAAHPDPEAQRQALLAVRPDIDFHVIENAGHWCMAERPEAFHRLITALCKAETA